MLDENWEFWRRTAYLRVITGCQLETLDEPRAKATSSEIRPASRDSVHGILQLNSQKSSCFSVGNGFPVRKTDAVVKQPLASATL